MKKIKNNLFPENFFSKERKEITTKEALKDVIPLNLKKDIKK